MKKHLFGVALFGLIVGTTVFIWSMFNNDSREKAYAPADYSTYAETKSCWKMKRNIRESKISIPVIRQALYNVKKEQIKVELISNDSTDSEKKFPMIFNFFKKDASGFHYIASEQMFSVSNSNGDGEEDKISQVNGSYDWLHDLDSYSNLYIAVDFAPRSQFRIRNFQPEFDAHNVIPVTLDFGK